MFVYINVSCLKSRCVVRLKNAMKCGLWKVCSYLYSLWCNNLRSRSLLPLELIHCRSYKERSRDESHVNQIQISVLHVFSKTSLVKSVISLFLDSPFWMVLREKSSTKCPSARLFHRLYIYSQNSPQCRLMMMMMMMIKVSVFMLNSPPHATASFPAISVHLWTHTRGCVCFGSRYVPPGWCIRRIRLVQWRPQTPPSPVFFPNSHVQNNMAFRYQLKGSATHKTKTEINQSKPDNTSKWMQWRARAFLCKWCFFIFLLSLFKGII